MEQSPFTLIKDLQALVQSRLRVTDIDALPPTERELLRQVKRQLADVRLDVREYGLSETRADQLRVGTTAALRLQELEKQLLKASEYGVFGAADTAIVSAYIEQLRAALKE